MNEWLKKVLDKLKSLWSKWKPIQKVILFGIIIVIIVAIIATARLSAKPAAVQHISYKNHGQIISGKC